MNKKNIIIGLGTGRCGSMSLAKLLNQQENFIARHESIISPWNFSEIHYQNNIKSLLDTNSENVAEIAFYLLPYTTKILTHYPKTKVVVLKRSKEEVVESYDKKTPTRNHWSSHKFLKFYEKRDGWDECYPTYDLTKRDAISQYWEDYYTMCENLYTAYKKNIIIFDMYNLFSEEEKQNELLDFLEISKQKRKINLDIKENSINRTGIL